MVYRSFKPDYMPNMFGAEASGTPTVGHTSYDLTLNVNEMNATDIRVSFRTQKYLYSAFFTQTLFYSYVGTGENFRCPLRLARRLCSAVGSQGYRSRQPRR